MSSLFNLVQPLSNAMSTSCPLDELTSTVCNAVQSLNHLRKANFLLDTSLALIEAGKCLSFSCRIKPSLQLAQVRSGSRELPRNIPEDPRSAKAGCCEGTPSSRECEETSRGTIVRASRPRSVVATYLTIAQVVADFQAVLKLEPSNKEIQKELKRQKVVCH